MTGRWEEAKADPMEGMSEEQKEYEAMQLVNALDKLQRLGQAYYLFIIYYLSLFSRIQGNYLESAYNTCVASIECSEGRFGKCDFTCWVTASFPFLRNQWN